MRIYGTAKVLAILFLQLGLSMRGGPYTAALPPARLPELAKPAPSARIAALRGFLRNVASIGQEGTARILLGRLYEKQGHIDLAEREYSNASTVRSPLGEYAAYWLAGIYTRQGARQRALPLWKALFAVVPQPSFKLEAASALLSDPADEGEPAKAIPYAEALYRANPNNPAKIVLLDELYLKADRKERARLLTERLWAGFPSDRSSLDFFKTHTELKVMVDKMSNVLKLERLRKLAGMGSREMLAKELKNFSPSTPAGMGWRLFLEGRLAERRGRWRRAKHLYRSVYKPVDASMAAIVRLGFMAAAGHVHKKEEGRIEKALINLPLGYGARSGPLLALIQRYERGKNESHAVRLAEAVITDGRPNRVADAYLYETAWSRWMKGDRVGAATLWRVMVKRLPSYADDRLAAAYTLLRLGLFTDERERFKIKAGIMREDEYGYFGYRLRGGPPTAILPSPRLPRTPTVRPDGSHATKGILLAAAGFLPEAARELEWESGGKAAILWTLCNVQVGMGDYPGAIRTVRELYPRAYTFRGDDVPKAAWRVIFPIHYRAELLKAARFSGIPVLLIASVVRQESLWNRRAVSRTGARGLMQLMLATARHTARLEGLKHPTPGRLHEAGWNTRTGSAYLARLLSSYGGKIDLALAAYNAGPGHVNSWLKRPGSPNAPDLFIESIPFRETRSYVRRVLLNTWEYERLYPGLSTKSARSDGANQ